MTYTQESRIMNVCSIKINQQVTLMTDYIVTFLFLVLPLAFFVYMAIDQLLWIHDMDLDTVIKNFYHKYIKKDQRYLKVMVTDEEIKAFWRNK